MDAAFSTLAIRDDLSTALKVVLSLSKDEEIGSAGRPAFALSRYGAQAKPLGRPDVTDVPT